MNVYEITGVISMLVLICLSLMGWIYWIMFSEKGPFARYERRIRDKNLEIEKTLHKLELKEKLNLISAIDNPTGGSYVYAFEISRPKAFFVPEENEYEIMGYTEDNKVADSYTNSLTGYGDDRYKVERVRVFKLETGQYAEFTPFILYNRLDKKRPNGYAPRFPDDGVNW